MIRKFKCKWTIHLEEMILENRDKERFIIICVVPTNRRHPPYGFDRRQALQRNSRKGQKLGLL